MSRFRFSGCASRRRARDERHLRFCVVDSHVRLQAADYLEAVPLAISLRALPPPPQHGQRPPEPRVGRRQLKGSRHDADHGVVLAGDRERPAEDIAGSGELALPEVLTEHDDTLASCELLARERAPDERRDPEKFEKLGTDESLLRALRLVGAGKDDPADARPSIHGHARKRSALPLPVEEVGARCSVELILKDRVRH